MRIGSGRLGGRVFDSPHGNRTHPMADRVRNGLFNALGDIEGLSVLDAFAGSGALTFEAISRGADKALAVESDSNAQKAILANIKRLELYRQVKLIRATVGAWLATTDDVFDIVFADPPYDDLQLQTLSGLSTRVKPRGLFVLSWPGKQELPVFEGLEQLKQANYGDAQLVFYRKIS